MVAIDNRTFIDVAATEIRPLDEKGVHSIRLRVQWLVVRTYERKILMGNFMIKIMYFYRIFRMSFFFL